MPKWLPKKLNSKKCQTIDNL